MEVDFLVSGSPEPRTGRGRRPSPPAQVHLGCPPCYLKEAPTLYHSGQSPLFSQTFPQSRLTIALSCSIAFYGSPRPPGSSPRDPPSPPPADLTPDYSYFLLWEGLGLHDTHGNTIPRSLLLANSYSSHRTSSVNLHSAMPTLSCP